MKKACVFMISALAAYFILISGASAQDAKFSKEDYEITVPKRVSIETMVQLGKYDYTDSICGEIYPGCESVHIYEKVKVTILQFEGIVGTDEVYQAMIKNGYRPAKFQELLALGAEMPDLQKQYNIIAFGSFWKDQDKGYAFGLKLCSYTTFDTATRNISKLRGLKEVCLDKKWKNFNRFLAVYEGASLRQSLALD